MSRTIDRSPELTGAHAIHGHVSEGFEPVREAFVRSLAPSGVTG
jgi:hypothetical protein